MKRPVQSSVNNGVKIMGITDLLMEVLKETGRKKYLNTSFQPSVYLQIHLKSADSVEDDSKLISAELSYIVVAYAYGGFLALVVLVQ